MAWLFDDLIQEIVPADADNHKLSINWAVTRKADGYLTL
jgi:hypothetical protein